MTIATIRTVTNGESTAARKHIAALTKAAICWVAWRLPRSTHSTATKAINTIWPGFRNV